MVYVITGGPGFGKTTLLNYLEVQGYAVCPESAREVMSSINQDRKMPGNNPLPGDFEKIIASIRLNFLHSIDMQTIAFSDRGLADQVAYSWYKNKIPSEFIQNKSSAERYAPYVFVTPPWKEIYVQDGIRKENFEEASLIHSYIIKSYLKYGYETVDLPLTSPELRARFILDFLGF
jgi:predicted ATPase